MTQVTMAALAPYFVSFQQKYGKECTLTVDAMEALLETATDDAALLEAMNDMMDDQNDDRSHDMPAERDERPGSAYSYAIKLDAQFEKDIDVLAQAAIENKRGGAVIMLDLFRLFGRDTVENVWPVPNTWKPGQGGSKAIHAEGNQAWDKEETVVNKVDGSSGKGTKSFYGDLVALSARGEALIKQRDEVKKAIGDVKSTKTKGGAIDIKLSTFKSAIIRAVTIAQRLAFVNNHTEMSAEVVLQPDGTVEASNKLIYIRNTKDVTKFDVITIGQFLALKVSEGATYAAIVGTTQRAPRAAAQAVDINVDSIDAFDKVTAAYATFFDKLNEALAQKDMKAYNALLTRLNAAGSDDLLLSLNTIMNGIEAILSKPGIDKRLGALIADGGKTAKAA